jgi:hypothetical protein
MAAILGPWSPSAPTGGRRAWGGVTADAVADDDLATAAAFGRSFGSVLVSENLLWLAALAAMIAG